MKKAFLTITFIIVASFTSFAQQLANRSDTVYVTVDSIIVYNLMGEHVATIIGADTTLYADVWYGMHFTEWHKDGKAVHWTRDLIQKNMHVAKENPGGTKKDFSPAVGHITAIPIFAP